MLCGGNLASYVVCEIQVLCGQGTDVIGSYYLYLLDETCSPHQNLLGVGDVVPLEEVKRTRWQGRSSG